MTATYSCANGVARIVLDAPERRNALDVVTLDDIARFVRRAEAEAACVVLAASGPVFSAGADFADLTGTSADVAFDAVVARTGAALRNTHLPVVVAVQGACLGAAVDLITSADVVIASSSARFEVPAVRLGILYSPSSLSIMRARLSGALVRSLMLGVPATAAEALAGGLVAKVVEPESLDAVVVATTARLLDAHRDAVSATKQLLNTLDEGSFVPDQWSDLRRRLLDTPERFDAITSRKRPTSS